MLNMSLEPVACLLSINTRNRGKTVSWLYLTVTSIIKHCALKGLSIDVICEEIYSTYVKMYISLCIHVYCFTLLSLLYYILVCCQPHCPYFL